VTYHYDCATETFMFTAADMAEHNRRVAQPKEICMAEDAKENLRRRRATSPPGTVLT
jgi:hypothetical protein